MISGFKPLDEFNLNFKLLVQTAIYRYFINKMIQVPVNAETNVFATNQ